MTVVLTGVALVFLGWFVTRTNAGLGMRAAARTSARRSSSASTSTA